MSSSIHKRNDFTKEEILEAIEKAEQEMIENGIVAVGDICNTADTLLQKQKGNLHYYNFIEACQPCAASNGCDSAKSRRCNCLRVVIFNKLIKDSSSNTKIQ